MKQLYQHQTDPCTGPALTIDCLSEKLKAIPVPQSIYRGIIKPSIGCFFGPSKSGKTTLAENLAFSVASGRSEFLGEPLSCDNRRVLIVSLEEFAPNRTARNQKQMNEFTKLYNLDPGWRENVYVIDESFPRYILTDEHWLALEREIKKVRPGLMIIDSLTRLTIDSIEDSSVATRVMKRLREITHKYEVAMVIIHHSQKMDNRPVTISTLAGSRVVGQELDFMIGVNRTTSNIRYFKDVAYRYWPDDSEFVTKFNINFNQVIESLGEAYESDILSSAASTNAVYDSDIVVQKHIQELTEGDHSVLIKTAELYERLVYSGLMARPTLHASLKRLENINVIEKPEKGCYRMKQPS